MAVENFVNTVIIALLPAFILSLSLYTVRVIKGPSVTDMVLAIDCITYDLCFLIGLVSILLKIGFLMVAALSLALWAYVLDLYVAKYLEGREMGD